MRDTIVFASAGTLTLTNGNSPSPATSPSTATSTATVTPTSPSSGNDASRVFNVNGGAAPAITASLNGLVIRDGFDALGGGGIRVADGAASSSPTRRSRSNVLGLAAAEFTISAALTLTNTIVSGNDADYDGGGILNAGTAASSPT